MNKNGVLCVGSAFPDPPFEVSDNPPAGFDIELMQAIAQELGLQWELHRYQGSNFEEIFDGLEEGLYDAIASGTTITDHRQKFARFCAPYVRSGQSLVVNRENASMIHSIHDLQGKVIGVQRGNTSEPVAQQLLTAGKVATVKVYAYDEILMALKDLEEKEISAFMKLEPVMRWLTQDRPRLAVVQTGITDEKLAIAVHRSNEQLAIAIERAQKQLAARGELLRLGRKWLAPSDPKTTEVLA